MKRKTFIASIAAIILLSSCRMNTSHTNKEDDDKPYVIYISPAGDRVLKDSPISSIVWVEDKDGNIKAIASPLNAHP